MHARCHFFDHRSPTCLSFSSFYLSLYSYHVFHFPLCSTYAYSLSHQTRLALCMRRAARALAYNYSTFVPVSLLFHPVSSPTTRFSLIIPYHICKYKSFYVYLRPLCSAPNTHQSSLPPSLLPVRLCAQLCSCLESARLYIFNWQGTQN